MKFFIRLTVLSLLGFCTLGHTRTPSNVMVEVSSVYCQPANPVNFNETFKVGKRYAIDQDFANMLPKVKNKLILRDKIRNANNYKSGRPPCPVGSVLIAEFVRR